MNRYTDMSRMDPLQMTRTEVANVPLIARSDLLQAQKITRAGKLDEAIQKQFPGAADSERVGIAQDLAEQLEDPHPYLVANVMRAFYARKHAGNSPPPGVDGGGDPEISRGRKRRAQER